MEHHHADEDMSEVYVAYVEEKLACSDAVKAAVFIYLQPRKISS